MERERMGDPIFQQFGMALVAVRNELTQAGKLEDALVVKEYISSGIYESSPARAQALNAATAAPERPFENSLGMQFVPLEVSGKKVLFCIHETRWKDYKAFAKKEPEIAGTAWENQTSDGWALSERAEDRPVVRVNWEDATAFCAWLSKRRSGNTGCPRITNGAWRWGLGTARTHRPRRKPRTER